MSFYLNNSQQMAINDSLLSLTEREMKYLKGSWAETLKNNLTARKHKGFHQIQFSPIG